MNTLTPGTRCQRKEIGVNGIEVICAKPAVRMVAVRLPLGPEHAEDMTAAQPDDKHTPMCDACASFHEGRGK